MSSEGSRDDAVFRLSGHSWLKIPVGKLHNDRNVPLHPVLVELISEYRAERGPSPSGHLVLRGRSPFDRRTIHRYVETVARRAGVGHVHPHQLRHTLGHPADQPGREPGGHRRPVGPPLAAHGARLCPDLRTTTWPSSTSGRWVRSSRRRFTIRTRNPVDHPVAPSLRQRALHPAGPARLRLPDDLRGVRVLRDRPRVHPDPAPPEGRTRRSQADFERARIYQELVDGLTTDKPLGQSLFASTPVARHRGIGDEQRTTQKSGAQSLDRVIERGSMIEAEA